MLKMTAEPRRGVATVCFFLCSRCVWHGAQQLARIGHRCSQEKLKKHNTPILPPFLCVCTDLIFFFLPPPQDPAGIFELVEVVGNGTYGQVYKVGWRRSTRPVCCFHWDSSCPPPQKEQACTQRKWRLWLIPLYVATTVGLS